MASETPNPSLPAAQFLTPAKLAWVMDVSDRTVAEWTGGRRKKAQITYFKKGRVIRFDPQVVLQFILTHTVKAGASRFAAAGPDQAALNGSQMELLWSRIERLIRASLQPAPAREDQPKEEVAA